MRKTVEERPDETLRRRGDVAAVRAALTVGVPVGVTGVAFGAAATAAGLSVAQACVLSLFAFTGASQYALTGAFATGANPVAAVAGALLLGSRNSVYGMRLRGRLRLPRALVPLAAHAVIDETTAVTLGQPDRRSARIGFGVAGVTLFVLWNLTTLAGATGARLLGDPAAFGLDAAGPAAFLALLLPRLRDRPEGRYVALAAAVLALGAATVLGPSVAVLAGLVAVPVLLGAVAWWRRTR